MKNNRTTPPYRDAFSGRAKTWPYGTTKPVEVIHVENTKEGSRPTRTVLACMDANKEGYVLVDGAGDEATARPGDKGTITFTEGGLTGGYWRYIKAA